MTSPRPGTFALFFRPDGALLDHTGVPAEVLEEVFKQPLYLHDLQGAVVLADQSWQFHVEVTHSGNRWVRFHLQDRGMSLAPLPITQAIDSSPIGIAIVSPEGRWLRVNPVLCEMLGYSREELLSCTYQDLTHPDDLDFDDGHVQRAMRREIDCFVFNKRFLRKDGEVIWTRLSSTLIWKDDGTPAFYYSHLEDITEQQTLQSDLTRALEHQQALIDVFQLLNQEGLTPMEVAEQVARRISEAAQVDWSCLAIQQGEEMHLKPMHRAKGVGGFLAGDDFPPVPNIASPVWDAAGTGKALYIDDVRQHLWAMPSFIEAGVVSVAVVPLHRVIDGQKMVFAATRKEGRPFTGQDQALFETALMAVDLAMERRQHLQALRQAALLDALTGLGNRRAFENDLNAEHARARRHNEALGLMVLDLDGLKTINDRMGHEAGDQLLSIFARHLKGSMRTEDRCYRLGGDEFAVILTHCPLDSSPVLLRRIEGVMEMVRGEGFATADVSVGVAFFPEERFSVEDLLRLADERMYLMKAQHHLEQE